MKTIKILFAMLFLTSMFMACEADIVNEEIGIEINDDIRGEVDEDVTGPV